jgi:hypothetical protein
MEQHGVQYQLQVAAFLSALADQEQLHRLDEQSTPSSIALVLPGPSQAEIISALMASRDSADMTTLTGKLAGEFELRLRDRARRSQPQAGGGLASLLLCIPYAELATVWTGLLEDVRRVSGFSLYERLRAYGLDAAVDLLWQRAAPTGFFAGRDHEAFGVTVHEVAVVALPPAHGGPEDERIRGELALRFHNRAENRCQVTDGAGGDELTVCRINTGWPIGIEQANHVLLQSYAAAGKRGHLPHLVGILTDSELGRPSPAYLAIAGGETAPTNSNGKEHTHEEH